MSNDVIMYYIISKKYRQKWLFKRRTFLQSGTSTKPKVPKEDSLLRHLKMEKVTKNSYNIFGPLKLVSKHKKLIWNVQKLYPYILGMTYIVLGMPIYPSGI